MLPKIMWEIDRALRAYRNGHITMYQISILTGIDIDRVKCVLQAEGL